MKIGFVLLRKNFLKVLGGTIDEALRNGCEVVLFFDQSKVGKKFRGMPALSESDLNCFKYGKPCIQYYADTPKLTEAIKLVGPDVIVMHNAAEDDFKSKIGDLQNITHHIQEIRRNGIPVVSVSSHFYDSCLLALDSFDSVDAIFTLSDYAVKAHKKLLLETTQTDNQEALAKKIQAAFASKVSVTGSTLMDYMQDVYQKKQQQQRIGSSVLFVPKVDGHAYMQVMFRDASKLKALARSFLKFKGRYFSSVILEPRFSRFLDEYAKFSKANGLRVIAKSRPKHGAFYEEQIKSFASEFHTGEYDEFYPSYTSAEILKEAAFCVHMRTFSVLEAVVAGVPSVCIDLPIIDEKHDTHFSPLVCAYVKQIRAATPGGMFNYPGCVWSVSWKDSVSFLKSLNLKNLQQDELKRREYVRYYCGVGEESSAQRQLKQIINVAKGMNGNDGSVRSATQ